MKEIVYLYLETENGFGNSAKNLIDMISEFDDVNLELAPLNKQIQNNVLDKKYDNLEDLIARVEELVLDKLETLG